MTVIEDHLFHCEHLWVKPLPSNQALIGISSHAQRQLGEIVYVDPVNPGLELTQGTSFGVIESAKVVSDLIAPVSGTVLEFNSSLNELLDPINGDPHGEGWLLRLTLTKPDELNQLMSAEEYGVHVGAPV